PPPGPPLAPDPPRRQRQERTVYTQSQQEVLESYFQNDQYPNYDKRLNLAKALGLKEHQLQVWFKNRRAKLARERRLQQQPQRVPGRRGRGARAAPLVPAAFASVPGGPEFPQSRGSCFSPQPGPWGVLPAAEPTIYSLHRTWGGPGCGAQGGLPAAQSPGPGPIPAPIPGPAQIPGPIPGPAQISGPMSGPLSGSMLDPGSSQGSSPAPISGPGPIPDPVLGRALMPGPESLPAPAPGATWPQSPNASNLLPETQLFPDFTELLPPMDLFEESSLFTSTSQYEEKDGSVDENHSVLGSLLDL
ncbi:PREDICTED: tetra-peptide repeat homeobox protein 1-like, partial [Mandrillus leucophaeus]|uniref:tetra-peptide repeat homeobox protein 1-like n=1 Tax=Mandrillus leucophaeus TaxID=9568 RepID=UPI0005F39F78